MGLSQTIAIGKYTLANGQAPFIVCEMACSHEGDMPLAKSLIDSAVQAGADCIQLQVFDPLQNMAPNASNFPLLQRLAFTHDQWIDIFVYAKKFDIAISCFAYDVNSLRFALEQGVDMVKLNSSDLLNSEMLAMLGKSDTPVTLGTGSSTFDEIARALAYYQAQGGKQAILMHGLQNFPTYIANLNIARMVILRETFNCLVGYADHTDGDHYMAGFTDLIAVGMGACIVEKHITPDRSKKGVDYQSALNPDEYKQYVQTIRNASSAIGNRQLTPLNDMSDRQYRTFQKKTIVAMRDIQVGELLQRDMIEFLRSDEYPDFSPLDFLTIEGKKIARNIQKYALLRRNDIE